MAQIIKALNVTGYPKERKNQFVFNVLLGMAFLLFFVAVKDTAIQQSFINGWFDYYIMFRMDSETDTQKAAQDITFLDFDDKSFQTLNKPSMTPRDKVAELLKIAYAGNAKVVVLDLDFSEPDYQYLNRDKVLFDTIEQIKNDSNSQTKILLPLTNYADKTLKPNVFSSLIDNKKVFAVTPTLTINRVGDNYARFWLPYLQVEDDQTGERKILWSIPLLSAVLYAGNFEELENIQSEILDGDAATFTIKLNRGQFTFYREQNKNGGLIRDTGALQYNRIQYVTIPPDVLEKFPFGTIAPANIGHWRKDGLDNKKIDCQNKIVIIGRADADCNDFFLTPIGNLTGMYIHGNSVASILGETRPHLTPLYKHVLIEIFLILIAAYSFLILSEFKAKCVVFIMTPLCWILTYVYFCFTNEFIYLCFAFTALGIYNFVNNIQIFIVSGFSVRHLFRRRVH